MRRTVILYALAMAALVFVLKYVEYRVFVRDMAMELYAGLIALLFTGLGLWAGWKLTHRPLPPTDPAFRPDPASLEAVGISKREHEVLALIAQGLSNREIADRLFLSPHTVKTHSSNLFSKLNARRRTEAIKRAKELGILG